MTRALRFDDVADLIEGLEREIGLRFADAVEALFGSELIKAATTPDVAPLFGSRPPQDSDDRPRHERDYGDQNQKLDRTDSWHGQSMAEPHKGT